MCRHIPVGALAFTFVALGTLWAGDVAEAQSTGVSAVVDYIAGPNVYVGVGSEQGLVTADTVDVYRAGDNLGSFLVVSASRRKAVLSRIGTPVLVTLGQTLDILFRTVRPTVTEEASQVAQREDSRVRTERSSIMDALTLQKRSGKQKARVSGRLSLGYRTLSSTTIADSEGVEQTRTFTTPTGRLRMTVADLPGGISVNTHLAASYRSSSYSVVEPAFLTRVYRLSVAKRFDSVPITVEAGRFYSPYENYSGYWDGVLFRYGNADLGGGIATGFQPDRSNERFDADMPKHTVFANFGIERGELRYATDISLHTIRPQNGLLNHNFAGWRQTLRRGALSLTQDVQMDQNPEPGGGWVLTRLVARAVVPAGAMRVHVGYSARRPYSQWRISQVFSTKRERIAAGLQVIQNGYSMGFDVTSNRLEGGDPYVAYSYYLSVSRTGIPGLALTGSGMYWSRDDFSALSANVGFSKSFGVVSSRVGYQYYQTGLVTGDVIAHSVLLSLNARLSRRIGANVQSRTQFGELLRSQSINTSLWISF